MALTGCSGLSAGNGFVDIGTSLPTNFSYDTSVFRPGAARSLKLAQGFNQTFFSTTVINGAYKRVYIYVQQYPAFGSRIFLGFNSGPGSCNLRITSSGQIEYYDAGTTLVGTSTTALSLGTWYRVEWFEGTATGVTLLKIDGNIEVVGNGTSSITSFSIGSGGDAANGQSFTLNYADVAANDSQFPGPGIGKLVLPASDSSRGTWTAGAGATTSLFDAVNNVPPVGTTAASETNTSQIKSATSSATDNCDFTMQTYTVAGVPSGATINGATAVCVHGEEVATGTKVGALKIVSNPAQTGENTFNFGDDVGACGIFPSSWGGVLGTGQGGSIIAGTAPVVRVGKRTATARVVDICFVGLWIDYSSVPGSPLPFRQQFERTERFMRRSRRVV